MKSALDAMCGDHAPAPAVAGAALAVREYGVEVVLVGDETLLTAELRRRGVVALPGLTVHHASQRVEMHEQPSQVVRRKRDSSIWVGTELVKKDEAVAIISAGNTGATVVTAFFLLGVLKGVERPAIATLLPTLTGHTILLDVGATVDCTPSQLTQFALMGHEYAQHVFNRAHPTIGLLSIGEEDTKGNEVTKETFKQLKESPLNFVGNVESRDIFTGAADVVVCDGSIGNVDLKSTEGVAEAMKKMLFKEIAAGALLSRIGYALLKRAFTRFKRRMDYAEFGGALLLGVNGICVICHGRSSGRAIKNAIRVAKEFFQGHGNEHLQRNLKASRAIAFDLAAACSGFLYGLAVADLYVRAGTCRRVLLVGTEVMSSVIDWTDRSTCILFGDGAGAALLEPSDDDRGVLSTHLHSDGDLWDLVCVPGGGSRLPASDAMLAGRQQYIKMKGNETFQVAAKTLEAAAREGT